MYKIGYENLYLNIFSDTRLFDLFDKAISKRKSPKQKEPKGNAKDGAYCPKEKVGQSWAHIDKSKEEDKDATDSNV